MYTVRYANLRDAKRLEELMFLSDGCSRRDWIYQDEPLDQVRAKTEYELAIWITNRDQNGKTYGIIVMVVEVELPINGTPGSRLVSDPPGDKTVVAFAVWRRLGSSPEVDYWRKFRAPSIDKKEEKAIFDSFKYLQSIPQPDAISSLQRETVMIGAENCAAAQYFSNRLAECWFLLEMYSHPRYGPSAHILLKWGLEMAGQENACVSTFQPKARCDFFFSYGFWPIGEVQIFCQDLIPKQGGEAGEVLDATFGAGGIRRVILRATQYSRANPFWSGASHNWRNADEKYKRNFYKTLLRLEERSARPEA